MRTMTLLWVLVLGAATSAAEEPTAVPMLHAIGTLHGFPSMSDVYGKIIADGELTQELSGDHLMVHVHWVFADGRKVDEHDDFRVGRDIAQEHFSWVETKGGEELRRFNVDFATGKAFAVTRDDKQKAKREEAQLDLSGGRAFSGYGAALAVTEKAGADTAITFIAFTPQPIAVTLDVHRDIEEPITVAHRSISCDRYTLHPRIPFPVSVFVGAKDAHLWLTHSSPHALLRSEQNLLAKNDPVVIVDAMPRGATQAPVTRGRQSASVSARPH
jgi:hypothetical protein